MRERGREREREREGEGRAIHTLLIHSIFVVAFILFFFFTLRTVCVFCIRYKIDIISSKTYRSVVKMTQIFDLEKCSISKTLLQVFKQENGLTFCNNGFLIHLYLLDPSRVVIRLSGLGFNSTLVF